MIVYGSSMSPYVRKVLAFAAEKGIEIETRPIGLGSQDPEFREASPFGKIPAFRDGDFTVADSSAIIAYLDTIHPEPELIPREARARARAIWYEEFADTIISPCAAKIFFNRIAAPRFLKRDGDLGAADIAEREELPPLLDYLEPTIRESGFLVDDRLTLADLAVASVFPSFRHSGVLLDGARYPKLKAYVERILDRPSFKHWVDREAAFLARSA